MWNAKKIRNDTWKIKISGQHLSMFMDDVHALHMSKYITIVHVFGPFRALIKWLCRTEFIISLGVCIGLLYMLMHIIWNVEVKGVTPETIYEIEAILMEYELVEGNFIWQMQDSALIEEELLHAVPNLLSVQIKKQGANYIVEAVEKNKAIIDNVKKTKQIRARKSGVIHHMFIQEGFPLVKKNERVQKGDILITNEINHPNEKDTVSFPSVEGKVYAETWYEITLTQPLSSSFKQIKKLEHKTYAVSIKDIFIPLPNLAFWKDKKTKRYSDKKSYQLYFLKWKTPLTIHQTSHFSIKENESKLTYKEQKNQLIADGIEQFIEKIGSDTEIVTYHVLYDTIEKEALSVKLYMNVLENIAIADE